MTKPKPLTRDQLAAFLKTPVAVRTFERMMSASLDELPEAIEDIEAGMTDFVRKDTLTTRGDLYVRDATEVVRLALGAAGRFLYSDGTDAVWRAPTTADITEGGNLYFSNERAQDAIAAALADTASVDWTYNDAGDTLSAVVLPAGVNHNALQNYDANQHVDHTGVTLTAGNGLTGGGDISASRSFAVGAGTGITVNADDVAINQATPLSWTAVQGFNRTFTSITDAAIILSSARPAIIFSETGVAANNGKWGFDCDATSINRSLFTDAGTDAAFEVVSRSGNTCTQIAVATTLYTIAGNHQLSAVGNKHLIKEGANASMGAATLVAGTVTVNNTLVTANSRIFLTGQNASGTHGELGISARVAGTSFTITSSSATDTRSVAWLIIEPAP